MSNVWFTSDHHFFHRNILKFMKDTRPQFSSIEEMNEGLIQSWNEQVKPRDIVYHLGDFAYRFNRHYDNMTNFTQRLNGHKFLCIGNHDMDFIKAIDKSIFMEIFHLKTYKLYKKKIVICHYPMLEWDGSSKGSWHLHGHSHGKKTIKLYNSIDVGIDCHNLKLVNYDDLENLITKYNDELKNNTEISCTKLN